MEYKIRLARLTSENLSEHPQAVCFINPKHPLYHKKIDWLLEQFHNGLTIQLLYLENQKKPVGFIEYVPGEFCWRAASAKDYLFIHCLWINGKAIQHQGLGSLLIESVEKEVGNKLGVAVVTSDASFMTTKEIFLKLDYSLVAESGKEQLLVKQFREGPLPEINPWEKRLEAFQGFHMIYTHQCPWVSRFMEEVKPVLTEFGLSPTIHELKTAEDAQQAPSLYASFNLIYNGKLLSDRYISITRFKNIIKKEL